MVRRLACAGALAAGIAAAPAAAQDNGSATVSFEVMKPSLAVEAAEAARAHCLDEGYQVAAAVVDRFGVTQALVRSRYAGPHTVDTAERKAYTAVSFRTDTLSLVEPTQASSLQAGARDIPNVLMLGGGEPVRSGGSLIGAVGVSGAPSGEEDAACAEAGIAAISDDLAF
jgi:uncharacterized protein GlcG (DUF336 family)